MWRTCPKGNPQRTDAGRARLMRRTAEHVYSQGDLKLDKAGCHDRGFELCFQQSAGNSPRPQVDVPFIAVR